MDLPSENAQPQIYVYSVKNGMAVDLGETLRAIFGVTGGQIKEDQREVVPTNPFARGYKDRNKETSSRTETTEKTETADRPETTVKPAAATVTAASTGKGPSSTLRGDVRITEDQIRNALVIEAVPGDYKMIERILERLDVLPRQVLIDVIIAEVTLGEGMEMGVEWTFKKGDWTDNGSLAAKIGSSGLQYAVGFSSEWLAALHAMANDSKLDIISSPSVLASDNKQARIDVTTEVPIPSTNYTYVTDGDNVLETSVEYRDTGVILDVTPHINEYGLVTMDINQEVSNVGALIKVAGEDYYSFDTRKIVTTLTVRHSQSIVIGGLSSNQKKKAASGVPWLVKIPIIRWLTGTAEDEEKKSELIVMITPHVITSLEDVDAVSGEFKNKIDDIKTVFK
jgi:general secretion pathway protein D